MKIIKTDNYIKTRKLNQSAIIDFNDAPYVNGENEEKLLKKKKKKNIYQLGVTVEGRENI